MSEENAHIEKKADPRFQARIAIFNGPNQDSLVTDYIVNVSTGGVFIETNKILPLDTQLVIKFKLPDMERIISCRSRVAWINGPDNRPKPSLPNGMGIQFVDLSLDDMHAIRHFIDRGKLLPTW